MNLQAQWNSRARSLRRRALGAWFLACSVLCAASPAARIQWEAVEPEFSRQVVYLEPVFDHLRQIQAGDPRPLRVLHFGDSHLAGPGECRSLGAHLEQQLGPWARGRIDYRLIAKNGASIRTCASWLQQGGTLQGIQALDPELVILSFGTNDSNEGHLSLNEFCDRFAGLLAQVRTALPRAAILVLPPPDRAKDTLPLVVEGERRVSFVMGAFFLDRWRGLGPGVMPQWQASGLAQADGVHLTQDGYRVLNAFTAQVLTWFYRNCGAW